MADLPATQDYRSVIERVSMVKDLDVQKLEKLLALQEEWERRQAEAHFNTNKSLAEGEMSAISKDASNPATRSKYATLAALDNVIRPIYTKYGFSIDFSEEPYKDDVAHVIASVHCGSITRHYRTFMPFSTQGARGGSVSTPTHAKMGAITYARRGLLKMIWNLAEEDDDGNTAGQRRSYTDPFPQPEPEPKPVPEEPVITVEEVLKNMERCWDEASLTNYYNGLKGTFKVSREGRDKINARYAELMQGHKTAEAPSEHNLAS